MDHQISPVEVTFSTTWFHCQYGFDFSDEGTWTDPIARTQRDREMERVLYDRFGDVGIGSRDPDAAPNFIRAYGNYIMPALFGCEIVYPKDQAPANRVLPDTSFEAMRQLRVPDFDKSPVVQKAFSDAGILKEKYGSCYGDSYAGSPLNVAVNIFGEDFLLACMLEPETAQHVLKVIAVTEFKLHREVSGVIEPDRFPQEGFLFGYGNCPAVMFSPALYREVILPVDKWVREQVSSFSIHHCGVFDDYIDIYKELDPCSLEIGGGSDYKAVRKAFPEAGFSLIVNAPLIEHKPASDIDDLIGAVVEGSAPKDKILRIIAVEVDAAIADDTVRMVRTAHERI